MADGRFPTLISKDRNANAVGNAIWFQASNGTSAGLIPGTGATDLGKAVDSAAGGTDSGVAFLGIRDDVLTTLTPADGDYVQARFNSEGALWVALSSSGFPTKVDDSAFSIGTDSVSPSGYLADETTPDSVDEGDVGLARMTLDRKQLFVLVDPTTDSQRLAIGASGDASVTVVSALPAGTNNIGDVDVLSVIPGVGATNLGKAVDDAAGATDTGVAVLGVRDDALTTLTPADGDYVQFRLTSVGAVWTTDTVLAANSETSPLYVHNVNTVVSGSEVHDEDEGVDVASDTADNHDYAVANATFLLKAVDYGCSGAMKVEVWAGPVASLVRYATRFVPAHGGGDQIVFNPAVEVPVTGTGTVRVIRTNREGTANSVYSTIIGNDIS